MRIFLLFIFIFTQDLLAQDTIDLKVYAQNILDGKIKLKEEEIGFRLLDSLFCKKISDRGFYFKVANKILILSDGAIAEYVSIAAGRFYFKNTLDFLTQSKQISTTDIHKWLDHIAFYLYFKTTGTSSKDLESIKTELNTLISDCKTCNKVQADLLKKYNKYIYENSKALLKKDGS